MASSKTGKAEREIAAIKAKSPQDRSDAERARLDEAGLPGGKFEEVRTIGADAGEAGVLAKQQLIAKGYEDMGGGRWGATPELAAKLAAERQERARQRRAESRSAESYPPPNIEVMGPSAVEAWRRGEIA